MPDAVPVEKTIQVNIEDWIDRAKADPVAYVERQATEVFLAALAMTPRFSREIFLKGGILMGVVYGSPRQTGDIDFTAISEPEPAIADALRDELNAAFPRAAARLGYPDLRCAVQSCRYLPSRAKFAESTGPALKVKIGYALRGSPQERHFEEGKSSQILEVDISFKEPVGAIQIVTFGDGAAIGAYSLHDLITEKIRALLQQEKRNRGRRQDFYDIASLLKRFEFDESEKARLLKLLYEKCAARTMNCPTPEPESLARPEVRDRAFKEWATLEIEIGALPDFEECFAIVDAFYRSLPWSPKPDQVLISPL
ncbi:MULTISPECIES: nucleotidyl transferase AbiEii/AbiGii toxin family protein [unclassified Novosphingobium]|uniref:nucleotidyl transferase AbiEii/AbiGii toxin family protein n=1 Tax=unclassified Novosphingobium TaxID=2644732 RepID=UPI001469E2B3|nr:MULTISPECIES: nucleotidyl transferase AbiEii/AbiGii toxin family protein [unclassified Novosphingobium]NMN05870.1 putative nucleotidyltransferase component of viral defense system [Novosphingobium sp. SG919]NMN87770.1 putative nucleotidyltransferase component of viral defense system [Novosphingobium sp. SG916]